MADDLASAVCDWFDIAARELPWRRADAGPWAVLVSEVMLQQTPVSRVLPCYEAWLRRWPTPAELADDSPGEAIRMWGKLGYPRRALRLHECAVVIVQRYQGALPAEVSVLEQLPGVGTYTARAVAAFAFGQRQPVVDTNVRRVLARTLTGRSDSAPSPTRDHAAALSVLPDDAAGAVRTSAALMELGALVCTARTPHCERCPLSGQCAWHRAGHPIDAPAGTTAPSPAGTTAPSPAGTMAPSPAGSTGIAQRNRAPRRPQRFAGTDRQVRGLLLDVLRAASGPVTLASLDAVWSDDVQRGRALGSLLADGLIVAHGRRYALPSHPRHGESSPTPL